MDDILHTIVQRRRQDLAQKGAALGHPIPERRERPLNLFLPTGGVILEIKRASPSRGRIAPALDAVETARRYIEAGAGAISILTEEHAFMGSLEDLLAVGRAFPTQALLRKDFLLTEDDIDVSYRAGADAVLLIARILDKGTLFALARRAAARGMVPLIEVREEKDVEHLRELAREIPCLAGVNSRDLGSFTIDPLVPARWITELPVGAVYESGIHTAHQARYAAQLGYRSILVGEEAVRNPGSLTELVRTFMQSLSADPAPPTPQRSLLPPEGALWRRLAQRRSYRQQRMRRYDESAGHPTETSESPTAQKSRTHHWRLGSPPLVKICGLTRLEDAQLAIELGADLLGFIFAPSVRAASASLVRQLRQALERTDRSIPPPLFVGIVTDAEGDLAREAFSLAQEGALDGIQYHGSLDRSCLEKLPEDVGRYLVVPLGNEADLDAYRLLREQGEIRILVDARLGDRRGGTGTVIQEKLLEALPADTPLWIAGGLSADNVGAMLRRFPVELIDASSKLESEPGIKDPQKMRAFFNAIA